MKKLLIFLTIVLLFPIQSFGVSSETIPEWIKNNAGWWATSQISDKDFVKGLEYLIQKGIIKIPPTNIDSSSSEQIPSWLRKNAGWWSQGLLSDDEFVKGIQYLVSKGIVRISQVENVCLGSAQCFSGSVTQIIDGDTIKVEGKSIRFALASAPELNEFGGIEAKQFVERLCPVGSKAIVDEDDRQTQGSYGRIIGVIYCNGVNLNEMIIKEGFGYLTSGFCDRSEFSTQPWAQKYGCFSSSYKAPQPTKEVKQIPKEEPKQTTSNCDPSYPDVCIPSPPPDLDCKDVPYKKFNVLPPDPHRFDGDKDGIGCES